MRPLAYPHTERLAWLTDYDPHIKSETVCLPGSSIWQTSAQFSPRWRQYVYRFAGRNRLWLSSQMRSKVALSWRSLCNRCLDEGLLSAERLLCFGQHPDKTGLPTGTDGATRAMANAAVKQGAAEDFGREGGGLLGQRWRLFY